MSPPISARARFSRITAFSKSSAAAAWASSTRPRTRGSSASSRSSSSPDELATDPDALMRFRREARAASALNHPNICTIYDIGEQDGHAFIVMEFLEGMTLKHRIAGGPIDIDMLLLACDRDRRRAGGRTRRRNHPSRHQARESLRDQSRAREDSRFRAGENARQPERPTAAPTFTARDALTSPGSALGTVAYMSPEQVRAQNVDARTDVFSFGVVLYEMATGTLPFRGDSPGVIADGILNRTPVPAVRLNPDVPIELERIIDKCLEKDRDLRYQHASEIRTDLQRLKRDRDSAHLRARPAPEVDTTLSDDGGCWRLRVESWSCTSAMPARGTCSARRSRLPRARPRQSSRRRTRSSWPTSRTRPGTRCSTTHSVRGSRYSSHSPRSSASFPTSAFTRRFD